MRKSFALADLVDALKIVERIVNPARSCYAAIFRTDSSCSDSRNSAIQRIAGWGSHNTRLGAREASGLAPPKKRHREGAGH